MKTPTAVRLRINHERVPWDASYFKRRWRIILDTLSDPDLLAIFRAGGQLPEAYGIGIDERCIEYPWFVANLDVSEGFVLDAGSTLNFGNVLRHPRFADLSLHIVTLAPEKNCFWQQGISYLFADLRDIPIRSEFYGAVGCLSTLEHVGLDNSMYLGLHQNPDEVTGGYVDAIKELRRVLVPGGELLVTVPFGQYRNFGSFQVFDAELLECAISAFSPASVVTVRFYRYSAAGWRLASKEECADTQYVDWVAKAHNSGLPSPLPTEGDLAAAARAVACVRLVKPA